MTSPYGPLLTIKAGGSEVLLFGIDEGEDAVLPGAKLVLCDPQGVPYLTLRVPGDAATVS